MAQAAIEFLKNQWVERDGERNRFFGGCFGIFGHGNVAGLGQALHQDPGFEYYLSRNEQAMVHTATAYAKASNRLRTMVCTSSIGPGATNMLTGAAAATVNRLPVLLLPGDIFARRNVAPVLQQLESTQTQDVSVNDCFRPVSRYWDRIQRPEQLITSFPEAMRILTSPAETGAVTIGMPQDVQPEAYDYPEAFFQERVWVIQRPRGDAQSLQLASKWIREAKNPLIVAGGGVLYSKAYDDLADFASQSGIPVAETQAGKGSLRYDHPQAVGAMGVTGTPGANILAREADLVIGIGTRYSDFTSASKTAFQNPTVRFININVAEFDAFKHAALPVIADARIALEELSGLCADYKVPAAYGTRIQQYRTEWDQEVDRIYGLEHGPPISQGEVLGVVNAMTKDSDVVVCAAGSMPGDMHKLWRTSSPNSYHMEYGYSTMGYEIAAGLGIKMARPESDVYVMVGDGSYLMMAQEIATSIQEGVKLNIVVVDNHGFASIGGLSEACGSAGFGTQYRQRSNGQLTGSLVAVNFRENAHSLGAQSCRATSRAELEDAVGAMSQHDATSVVVIETDGTQRVPSYETWWDVPVAEVSSIPAVVEAREQWETGQRMERAFL
jgi:3D-(3,5/4)-trihydroxycyclohexane-1,2-dione acylhydrolase (decyclizing)